MRVRLSAVVLLVVLGFVACGGNGNDDVGSADREKTGTTSAGLGNSTSVAPDASDAAVVNKIVLEPSDFPPGWTSAPLVSDDEEAERALAACLGLEYTPGRPRAESPQFSKGELPQALAAAELAPTADVAAAELAAVKGPKGNECIKRQFDKQLQEAPQGDTFKPVQVQALQFPKAGDESVALRLTTALTGPDGSSVPLFTDVVLVRRGRAEMSLFFVNAGEPFPAALAADLTQKLASRA